MVKDITYDSSISLEDYCKLRKAVGWKALSERQLKIGLAKSIFLTAAYLDGQCIGMTRLLGDDGYFYQLVDVMVLPEHQGKGIGRSMLEMAMAYIKNNIQPGETAFVNLISAGGKEPFYRKFGLNELPNGAYGHGMALYITK